MHRRSLCLLLALSCSGARSARADELSVANPPRPSVESRQLQVSQRWLAPGPLAGAACAVPSFILRGSCAFATGDRATARRLAISEGVGISTLLAAGTLLAVTGTSRRLVGTLVPLAIGGFSVFMLGWLADVYAATTGGRTDRAARFVPELEGQLGYLYVHDPQFRYRNILSAQLDLRAGALRVSPAVHVAADDNNQRFGLELAYRAYGLTPRRAARDGSYADLVTGVRHHRYASDDFAVTTPEWSVQGRLDLARVGASLAGSFVQGELGAALELYDFAAPGSRVSDNATGMLLASFGFGVYFGDGEQRSGEAQVYYDHRHDDFAAGLGTQGIAAGILGHFGARGLYYVTREWGLSGVLELGAAVVSGLSLRYRWAPEEAARAH